MRIRGIEAWFPKDSMLDGACAELGLPVRSLLASDSRVAGSVVVEAFFCCVVKGRDGSEVLVIESRIL